MILQILWPTQERKIGHTWEMEFQPLGILLVGRNKGSISGFDCYIPGVFGKDFVGGLTDNVIQQLLESVGLLGVDFGMSKLGQTISRFLWVLHKEPRYKFAEFSKHHRWCFQLYLCSRQYRIVGDCAMQQLVS